ncbi:tRNA A-37 threonylcarbamoyl transferase component Bud32 [Lentzea californiensis]|uniref:tRNA A-37 threonylcarbamoyl transferase component Bud32 n=1 Tax=Lentzea flaviverrucosa TaxID=200379 RepID=A0A1H9U499_9PSEU|nr:tRNA A-37 threonylcarbamoyl transferase component Bud32 [Lentzea californiensis]RDI33325.1 tRNA A-37 threonylcarbamoyl transferase component Bud32 [Lentzea flaviverrucosa]SES03903.1 tRNA A-37 threonylcarbamoyl transferase component Bud32 [Lentzea flaviverrucosa]
MFIRSDGLLVKRTRTGRDLRREAEMMSYLSGYGIPVPRVHEATEDELVMQYVPGPRMSEEIGRKPWLAGSLGEELADLHHRLDVIPAPGFLTGDGDLLHLDLHPGNVVLGPEGPVVLDWASATKGDRRLDVALSWVSLAVAHLAPVMKLTRWRFLRSFMANVDPEARNAIPEAARIRLERHDRDPRERAALQKLMDRERH